jgi:hypothetical protein
LIVSEIDAARVRELYQVRSALAVFMDEVMPINGPLMVVPRSHRQGVLAAGHDEETTSYPLWTVPDDALLQYARRAVSRAAAE